MMRTRLGRLVRKLADRLDPPAYTVKPNPRGGVTIAFRDVPLADVEIGRGMVSQERQWRP